MADPLSETRVYFLGNPEKPDAASAMAEVVRFATPRCTVVGSSMLRDDRAAVAAKADRIVVVGGDGTLIGVARSLGKDQIPLIGVNIGKLGFLAEFSIEEFKQTFDRVMSEEALIGHRAVLKVTVQHKGSVRDECLAINDCVIQAGPPFRLIRLGLSINGNHLTDVGGDGLIVCTPSGSTAHNLSAGGPIAQPGVDAIVLTPMNPHSLTHRSIVIERESVVDIFARAVNPGTTATIDGQVSCPLQLGDRVTVRRFETDFMLVHNPLYPKWHNLVTKLHWGRQPNYDQ